MDGKIEVVSVRIPAKLKTELERISNCETRSVSQQILHFLRVAAANWKKSHPNINLHEDDLSLLPPDSSSTDEESPD